MVYNFWLKSSILSERKKGNKCDCDFSFIVSEVRILQAWHWDQSELIKSVIKQLGEAIKVMCYEGVSIVLRKRTCASQVDLLEFPEGVTGHVKMEIQHIQLTQISKTPSVQLLIKDFSRN